MTGVQTCALPIYQGSQPVTVFSDPKRVVQVISNFLTNAIKFTSEGEIKLAYKVSNDEIRVSVSDTGMGISEEDCRTIFDRFVKLNACKQGTGLGLAICKNIIENLGGRIGVESTLRVGSTFWFTLPLKEIKEDRKSTRLNSSHPSSSRMPSSA